MASENDNLLTKALDGIKISGKWVGKDGDFEIFKNQEHKKPFFLPTNLCKGMGILVSNEDGNVEKPNKDYAGALQNVKYRSKIRKLDKSLEKDLATKADPLQNIIYVHFPFNGAKNISDEQGKIWSAIFCNLLGIVKPTKLIVNGKKIGEFLVSEIFEDVAKDVWNLDTDCDGQTLKTHMKDCNFIGLPKERINPKKEREIQRLRQIINELGSVIAEVKDVFDYVKISIEENDDPECRYYWWPADSCRDQLNAPNRLLDIWESLKEMKFRLENNNDASRAEEAIENASIFKEILKYLEKENKTFPCNRIKSVMIYVKWLKGKKFVDDNGKVHLLSAEEPAFGELLEWAFWGGKGSLRKNEYNGIDFDELLSIIEKYKTDSSTQGVDKILNSAYNYFVSNLSPRNSHYADLMEKSFVLKDGWLWKPDHKLWQRKKTFGNIPYENYLVDLEYSEENEIISDSEDSNNLNE